MQPRCPKRAAEFRDPSPRRSLWNRNSHHHAILQEQYTQSVSLCIVIEPDESILFAALQSV